MDDDHDDAPPTRHTLMCYLDPKTGLIVERQFAGGKTVVESLDDPYEDEPTQKQSPSSKDQSNKEYKPLSPPATAASRKSISPPPGSRRTGGTGTAHSNYGYHHNDHPHFNELDEESKKQIIDSYVKPIPIMERVSDALTLVERKVDIPNIQVRLDASSVVGGKNNLIDTIPFDFNLNLLMGKAAQMVRRNI